MEENPYEPPKVPSDAPTSTGLKRLVGAVFLFCSAAAGSLVGGMTGISVANSPDVVAPLIFVGAISGGAIAAAMALSIRRRFLT